MKPMRILFVSVVVSVLCYGWSGWAFHQETEIEFKGRICELMGWQPEDVDIALCQMIDEELRHWK